MSVTAPVSGPSPVTQAIPVASLAATPPNAATGAAEAGRATPGNPVDVVSLSPTASLRLAMDAPDVTLRVLGSLLQEFEQIDALTVSAAPLLLGELAGEIGTAAHDLGTDVQALTLQLAAIELPPAADAPAGATPDPRLATASLAFPATLLTAAAPLTAAVPPILTPAPVADVLAPGRQDAQPPAAARDPALGDAAGTVRDPHAAAMGIAGPDGGHPGTGAKGAAGGAEGTGKGAADPARQVREDAGLALDLAAGILERMQLRLHGAPPARDAAGEAGGKAGPGLRPATGDSVAFDPAQDILWCEAQIAAALAQVGMAMRFVRDPASQATGWWPAAGLLGLYKAARRAAPGRPGRMRTLLGMLCVAAAVWLLSRLGPGAACLAAAPVALGGLAWAWRRRAPWRRLSVQLRR